MHTTETSWVRVTHRQPCPICGRPDWCGVAAGGEAVICMRVESDVTTRNGGWLHRLSGYTSYTIDREIRRDRVPLPAKPRKDWSTVWRLAAQGTDYVATERLARQLGVSSASLHRVGAAWSPAHWAWMFPMYAPDGRMTGLRLRNEQGRKWCVPGSKQGHFVPDGGSVPDLAGELIVCEGPTDLAALVTLDLPAIGRPSCSGGEEDLAAICAGREVVLVADRDEPKTRPDGSVWFPGQAGAERAAEALFGRVKSVRIIKPVGCKDFRQWLIDGATADVVRTRIRQQPLWRPGR